MVSQFVKTYLLIVVILTALSGCGIYRQNIMLQVDSESSYQDIIDVTEQNYVLQSGDEFELDVYSNNGELIVDPNFQLRQELGVATMNQRPDRPSYLVDQFGVVKLPLIGWKKYSFYV